MELPSTSWQILLLFTVFITLTVKYFIDFVKKLWLLPPGPWGLPVVGYLPWMKREVYLTFAQLGNKYGGLFSVQMGGDTVVVLNDWPTIKATLVDHPKVFSGRPKLFMQESATENKDIGFSNGLIWHKQRRLTIQCLRNIGMGKKSTGSIVTEIVHQLLDKLSRLDDQVVEMESTFFEPILTVNWEMVSGGTVSGPGVTVKDVKESFEAVIAGYTSNNLLAVFPWLRFIPPNGFGFKKFVTSSNRVKNLIRKVIDEHITNWKEGQEVDLIDHYITEIKKNESVDQITEPPYNVEHLIGTIWDIFIAGNDTTNATCLWGFLYIGCNPEVQQKAQSELDSVVGRERLINVNDFPSLPYLDALLKEVHRVSSIVPLSVPHCPITDFHIRGYTIPRGTICLQNIYGVHYDPKLWEEPHVFRPERFLHKDNKPFCPQYLMPFSIGSRMCLGQSNADMELKLIFGGLLQRFTFTFPKNHSEPNFQPEFRFVQSPKPYSLHIKLRN